MKTIIFFLIFQVFNLYFSKYIAIKDVYGRFTYAIYDKNCKYIGEKIKLIENEQTKNTERYYLIYILNNGKIYMEIFLNRSIEHADISFKINKLKKLKDKKDTGIEEFYKFKINFAEKIYEFDIFADVTYFYLKDGDILRKNRDAIIYMINKDNRIKEFIEIMANDIKGKFSIFFPFKYVFAYSDKNIAKDLNLDVKKYKFKKKYFDCTEIENMLGHNCSKFITFPKK
jgi:hypothetical protein